MRQLLRSVTFTFGVVLTLALGIGLNAAIFTMVDCVLLRPLGYRDADRIYSLNTRFLDENRSIAKIGGRGFRRSGAWSTFAGIRCVLQLLSGWAANRRAHAYTDVAIASPQFGQVMGVEPVAGRLFLAGTETAKRAEQRRWSVRPSRGNILAARQARWAGAAYRGPGEDHRGRVAGRVLIPRQNASVGGGSALPRRWSRTAYNQRVIGKIKPGITAGQLNAEMATLPGRLSATYPEDKTKALEAVPLQDEITGKIRPILRLLMAAVVVVLLIVCANIAHLQLVRATSLRREVTIRTALGRIAAGAGARAALEVVLLAVAGCMAGVMVAVPAQKLLIRLAPPEILGSEMFG